MEDFKLELDHNEENSVFYEIHPAVSDASSEQLQKLRDNIMDTSSPFVQDYIWQRDSFALQSSTDQHPPWNPEEPSKANGDCASNLSAFSTSPTSFLWGSARFGDNLEDEWFITWLLFEITRCIPGTAARVWDNDGEFLLIEAAYALPKWLKPETACNRVWLLNGLVHIVPLPTVAAPDLPSFPSLQQAKQIVQGDQVPTLAAPKMQQRVAARLKGYPQKAHRQMHKTRVILPAKVAALLREDPGLAGPAVDAFYNRDVDDMQAAAHMCYFPPQDMLSIVVTLNRCMYAQLEQQEFEAPSGFSMPPSKSPQHSAAQRGMKLTCGFEMLYARSSKKEVASEHEEEAAASSSAQEVTERAVSGMPAWQLYKAGLEQKGYFKENIPGSQQYKELMQQALQSFMQSAAYRQAAAAARGPASRIDAALQRVSIESPEYQRKLEEAMQGAEDDDAWMRDGADDLEQELAAREREMPGKHAASSGSDFDPDSLAQRFKSFMEKESGPEGAEIPTPAAAGRKEGDVSMDYKHFWRELGDALGMQPGDSDAFLKDMESDSDDEGSSFFGDNADKDDSDDEDGVNQQGAVFSAQHVQRSAHDATSASAVASDLAAHRAKPAPADDTRAAKSSGSKGFAFRFPETSKAKAAARDSSLQPSAAKASMQQPQATSAKLKEKAQGQRSQAEKQPASAAQHVNSTAREDAAEDEQWDAMTETDSDDEYGQAGSPDFMSQYAAAMEAELGSSHVGNTFAQPPQPGISTQEGAPSPAAQDHEEELQPVDLDVNLVENLLASYAGQQGLPGPASNLAGLMGISLPDNMNDFA